MSLLISRLRRWFAVAAVLVCLMVAGTYFYAKHRVQNALKQIPGKIGINIQQSAQGFTISKSEQGRTLFKLQASRAVQFKQSGQIELHNVAITLYGRDSSRFDQVYGEDFEYDQQSGDVTSKGEVSIDLQANPEGILNPDQAPPEGTEKSSAFENHRTGLQSKDWKCPDTEPDRLQHSAGKRLRRWRRIPRQPGNAHPQVSSAGHRERTEAFHDPCGASRHTKERKASSLTLSARGKSPAAGASR